MTITPDMPPVELPPGHGAILLDVWRPWGAGDRSVGIPGLEVDEQKLDYGFAKWLIVVPAGRHRLTAWDVKPERVAEVDVVAGTVLAVDHATPAMLVRNIGRFAQPGSRPRGAVLSAVLSAAPLGFAGFFASLAVEAVLLRPPVPRDAILPIVAVLAVVQYLTLAFLWWRRPRSPLRRPPPPTPVPVFVAGSPAPVLPWTGRDTAWTAEPSWAEAAAWEDTGEQQGPRPVGDPDGARLPTPPEGAGALVIAFGLVKLGLAASSHPLWRWYEPGPPDPPEVLVDGVPVPGPGTAGGSRWPKACTGST